MVMKVILDTNFVIDLIRFKTNLENMDSSFDENLEIHVIERTVEELQRIASEETDEGKFARLAIEIIKRKGIKMLKTDEKNTDDALLDKAKEGYVIATNDVELRERIKKEGMRTIYLRGKKEIMMS